MFLNLPPAITPRVIRLCGVLLLISTLFPLTSSCDKEKKTPTWSPNDRVDSTDQTQSSPPIRYAKVDTTLAPVRFMAYNLRNYLTMPRTSRGKQVMKPKPEKEIVALISHIKSASPDIIGICEIGTQADLNDLSKRLAKVGLDYPHSTLCEGPDQYRRLALLSRYPLTNHTRPPISYKMDGHTHHIRRGILDASIKLPGGSIRVLGAHLKSKRPSKYADQELVRRNEARLIRRHASYILTTAPHTPLLLYGDFNDTKHSATIRSLSGAPHSPLSLTKLDIRAADGSRWTHYWHYQDVYSRFDYAFVSPALKARIDLSQSYILDTPKDDLASDHRALIVTIR